MPTLTFDEICERVSAHHTAEDRRNAVKPAAVRAVFELRSLMMTLTEDDRLDVAALLTEEMRSMAVTLAVTA